MRSFTGFLFLATLSAFTIGAYHASRGAAATPRPGSYALVYSFRRGTDGSDPGTALTPYGGALYGTTIYDGSYTFGTVIRVTPNDSERVLTAFQSPVGVKPLGNLVEAAGKSYGTTVDGGGVGRGSGTFSRSKPQASYASSITSALVRTERSPRPVS